MRNARSVMSSRFPMGVETTNSVAGHRRRAAYCTIADCDVFLGTPSSLRRRLPAYLQEVHPTTAALDGVHAHDDLLEDLGRSAIEADSPRPVRFRAPAERNPLRTASPRVERVEHPIVAAHIKARMFEAEEIRTWERNPQLYADVLASSLAAQALFAYAPQPNVPAGSLEAAADAPPDSVRPGQREGSARHFREGRHRDAAGGR